MTRREYENERIRVLWDSSRCIHTAICLKRGEGVFDAGRRPWVDLDAAGLDVVVATIEACPSGALRYERLDGSPGETPDVPTTMVPWPDGPLLVRGDLEVRDRTGNVFTTGPRAAICRCGASSNQPFCDLSHRGAGFRDNPRVEAENRDRATAPTDITERPLDA